MPNSALPVCGRRAQRPFFDVCVWPLQAKTPISLKATAGLRLLPGGQATEILDAVRTFLGTYPFKMAPDAVSILDGERHQRASAAGCVLHLPCMIRSWNAPCVHGASAGVSCIHVSSSYVILCKVFMEQAATFNVLRPQQSSICMNGWPLLLF